MIIKQLDIKSFGKFQNAVFNFENGLNIITGDNESGKSTIASFIKYMLFGKLDKNARTNKELLQSYEPWDSASHICGSMTVEIDGREYRIEREQKSSAKYAVYDVVTGDECPQFMADAIGTVLFGVDVSTFEKTAYVKQSELEIGKSAELEVKLRGLLCGAQSDISYESVKKIIEDALRKNSSQRSENSLLSRTEKKINLLEAQLQASYSLGERYTSITQQIADEKKQLDELIEYEKQLENRKRNASISTAFEKLEKIKKTNADKAQTMCELKSINDTLVRSSHIADSEYIAKIDSQIHNIVLLEQTINDYNDQYKKRQAEFNDTALKISDFIKDEQDIDKIKQLLYSSKRLGTRWRLFSAIGSMLVALIALYSYMNLIRTPFILAISICFFVASAIFSIIHYTTSENRIFTSTAQKYGYKTTEELAFALNSACVLIEKKNKLIAECELISNNINEISKKIESKTAELSDLCALHMYKADNCEQANRLVRTLEQNLKTADMLKSRIDSYDERIQIILDGDSLEALISLTANAQVPKESVEQLEYQLHETRKKINALMLQINTNETQRQVIYENALTPDEIAGQLMYEKNSQKEIIKTAAALEFARSSLDSAYEQLKDTFAPAVNALSGRILSSFTNGKYSAVAMNSDNMIKLCVESGTKKLESFSAGTKDIVYLAVRLSVAKLIFSQNMPPVVIDDSFSRMDINRISNAMKFLEEMGQMCQILLFSCRENEKNITDASTNKVNI